MKLAAAFIALALTASLAEARRLPTCAKDAVYPKDLPAVACPSKIESAPRGQVLTFTITYDARTPEDMAKMYTAALGQKKWKATRTGTSVTAKHGHDKVEITVTAAGTSAIVQLVYTPA